MHHLLSIKSILLKALKRFSIHTLSYPIFEEISVTKRWRRLLIHILLLYLSKGYLSKVLFHLQYFKDGADFLIFILSLFNS